MKIIKRLVLVALFGIPAFAGMPSNDLKESALALYEESIRAKPSGVYECGSYVYAQVNLPYVMGLDRRDRKRKECQGVAHDLMIEWIRQYVANKRPKSIWAKIKGLLGFASEENLPSKSSISYGASSQIVPTSVSNGRYVCALVFDRDQLVKSIMVDGNPVNEN